MHARTILTVAALSALLAAPADAASQHAHPAAVTLADGSAIQWQPGPANLPKGTQIVALAGDPAKPGPFVLRIKFPANTVIAPHTHSKDETLTILAGSIYHQHGKTVDKTKGEQLKAGGFVYLPEAMPHALWTTDEEVVLQVNGSGPFGVDYLNPADDPSRAQK